MAQLASEPVHGEILALSGRKGLVLGIANQHSLAWSAAKHFRNAGAELAVSYLNDMAKLAEPLMDKGGSLMTLSYYGAEKVVDHYNVMGPVKAALEASVRYLAHELGPKGIRVNAISAGAVKTRAASGIAHFEELLNETMRKAPLRRTVDACEVGRAVLLLASDYTAAITGEVLYVDAGFHIEGMVFH